MASVFLKASTGNNYDLIEPDPNPELVPKSGAFEQMCVMSACQPQKHGIIMG
jgi:hypothetical protein